MLLDRPECQWIAGSAGVSPARSTIEQKAQGYAIAHVVPGHLAEVKGPKLDLIAKTEAAVKDRLTKEITYWDHRAEELKLQEQAGPTPSSTRARPVSGPICSRGGYRSGWRN